MKGKTPLGLPGGTLRRRIAALIAQSDELGFLHRLHLVLLMQVGLPATRVGAWFDTSARTLRRWHQAYGEQGLNGLHNCSHVGRPRRLSEAQLSKLRRDVLRPPDRYGFDATAWNGPLLQSHIGNKFRIDISQRQCQRLLTQLREAPQKPSS